MNATAISRTWLQALVLAWILSPAASAAPPVYRITDIGMLDGATRMGAADMNESGQVTGYASGINRAYLWDGTSLINLGTLGGSESGGNAINNAGQVTGISKTAEDLEWHAFLWDGTSMQDLGTLGGTNSYAEGINDSGQVTGVSDIAGDAASHAFLWNGEDLLDLGTLGGAASEGRDINAAGQVTGIAKTASGADRAFRWSDGVMQDLGTLGGAGSGRVNGDLYINASGQVAGASDIAGSAATHAFLWSDGTMQDVGALLFSSDPLGINDAGQIVGTSTNVPPYPVTASRAFLWDGGNLLDLGNLGGTRAGATGINGSGHVLGNSALEGDTEFHPFLWIEGVMYDLTNLIDPADPLEPFVTLGRATDINDHGQILVHGTDSRTSGERVYVLSPIVPDVFLNLAALTDVNGTSSADVATLVAGLEGGSTVYVNDGASGDPIAEIAILDADWRAIDMAVTPGGAGAVIGVLAQKDDGSITVAVHRARDGALVREIPYFGPRSVPSALAYVPNATGPGNSAFAVIAKNLDDQRISVQLKKRSDGSLINTNRFFLTGWDPIELDTVNDLSGNGRPELVVLARSEAGLNQVVIRDAETKAIVNKINYFGPATTPKAAALLGDIGGSAAPEISVLGELPDGRFSVQNRDALTDERITSVSFFGSAWTTIGIEGLGDVNGNTSPDLAVLAQHDTNHAIKAQVRDASTGDLVRTVTFLNASWSARAFAAFADIDGNGVQELGVAAREEDGTLRVQLRDAATGAVVSTIDLP